MADVVGAILASFVPLKVNADSQEVFADRYRADVLPTTLILDGNGRVLATREHRAADKPGDTNLDGTVDFVDVARLAADWLEEDD